MVPLRQADSIGRTAQVCPPNHFDEEQHLARAEPSARGGQTPGQTRPVKAVSRRSRARVARALTGVDWSGSAIPSADRSATPSQIGLCRTLHRPLERKGELGFCNVRRCQKNCDKPLHYLTIDRRAPLALYPAVKRSVVGASPALRYPSKLRSGKSQAKRPGSRLRADSLQSFYSRGADH